MAYWRGATIGASVVEAATDELYHTTSLQALAKILQSRTFKSRSFDAPFISFSQRPHFGDIRGNDAVIVLDMQAVRNRLMPVEYSERWYERFPEHAAYVAGEGWREQYEEPDDCYDEEGWADEDCVEQAYRDAELQAFLDKSGEREWLSRAAGDLRLPADAFKRVVCSKAKLAVVEALIKKLGLKLPVKVLRDRSTGRVQDLGAEQAGPERDELLDRIANMKVGASHSHERCMECKSPPETVVLWADGRGRAWFCKPCLTRWEAEEERDVVRRHKLRDGEDPREFRGRGGAEAGADDEVDEATALETPKKYRNRTGRCPPGHRGNEKETCIDMKERRKKRRWEQQQRAKERREAGR
jgi:hypothetical protein